jgi:hypothetical protein
MRLCVQQACVLIDYRTFQRVDNEMSLIRNHSYTTHCGQLAYAVCAMHYVHTQLVIGDDRGYITVCNSANGAFVKVCVHALLSLSLEYASNVRHAQVQYVN